MKILVTLEYTFMNIFLISILAFAVSAGQLIRFPFGTGGISLLDITIVLLSLGGLAISKFQLIKPPLPIVSLLAFISIGIISLILTPLHLITSEYFNSFSYSGRLFIYVLFAWLLASNVFGELGKNIIKVFSLSGVAFAILGLLQFIFFPNLDFLAYSGWDPHYFRTVSTFLDPNFAGAFLVLTLLLISQRFFEDKRWNTIFFITVYLALLTTFSRSSYFMFLASGLIFSILKKSKILFLAVLLLFLGLIFGFQLYSQAVAKPRNIDRGQSASFRLSTWQQGITLFQKSPVLGVGFNAYRYGVKEYNLSDNAFLQSHGSSSNDSSLLFVLSTTGILGFGIYLFFLWSLIKTAGKQSILIKAAVAGLLIHSFFANSLFYPPILAWLIFISVTSKK